MNSQVPVGNRQPVPEIFTTADVARCDAPVVTATVLRLQVADQQPLEHERQDHEQRIRQVRKSGLLPLFHGPEEIRAARHFGRAEVPAKKLLTTPGDRILDIRRARGRPQQQRRLIKGRFQQSRHGRLGHAASRLGLLGNRLQVADDLVVDGIEQQQIFALSDEVIAQLVFEQHIEHGQLAEGDRRGRTVTAGQVPGQPVLNNLPIDGNFAVATVDHGPDPLGQPFRTDRVGQ